MVCIYKKLCNLTLVVNAVLVPVTKPLHVHHILHPFCPLKIWKHPLQHPRFQHRVQPMLTDAQQIMQKKRWRQGLILMLMLKQHFLDLLVSLPLVQ